MRWGSTNRPPRALGPMQARAFYRRLLAAQKSGSESLMDILADCLGDTSKLHGSSWVLAFPRMPAGFNKWFCDQLIHIRVTGITISIVTILMADALPCKWRKMQLLWDSPFQNRMFTFSGCRMFTMSPIP